MARSANLGRPTPRKRVANRRALIVGAAAKLFAERGYPNVGMGDIAAAVGVGPSALYRHFAGKEQLLSEATVDTVDRFMTALDDRGSWEGRGVIERVAGFALDERPAGVLWQREARHLPPALYEPLRDRMRQTRDAFAQTLHNQYQLSPGQDIQVLAMAALGVLFSPSFHHVNLPRADFEELLTEIVDRLMTQDTHRPSGGGAERSAGRDLIRVARREQILATAMRLFAQRTYASVAMEEIAAATGLAASSVYNHFPSKVDILSAALSRGNGYLQLTLEQVVRNAADTRAALAGLVGFYSRLAVEHPAIVDLMITEIRSLAPAEAAGLIAAQRDYIAEWVHLYGCLRPDVSQPAATVVVEAALMLINDLARTAHVQARADASELVSRLASAALGL